MNRNHEKLLVAALAGLVIAGAAAYAVQPVLASGYDVDGPARVVDVDYWDVLNVRRWPDAKSVRVGELLPLDQLWVVRCVEKGSAADWCLIEHGSLTGWVNANYLEITYDY